MPDSGSVVRVAAMGDLHCSKKSQGQFQAILRDGVYQVRMEVPA